MSQSLPLRAVMPFVTAKSCHEHARTPLRDPRRLHNPFTRAHPTPAKAKHRAEIRLRPYACLLPLAGWAIASAPRATPQGFVFSALVIATATTAAPAITAPGACLTTGHACIAGEEQR